jgi:carbonic anhydrase
MKALLEGPPPGMPALEGWLRHARPSLASREASEEIVLDGGLPAAQADKLALHNVLQQLDHLRQYPIVAEAEARGELQLAGMYFDVGAAQVYLYDPPVSSFVRAGAESPQLAVELR